MINNENLERFGGVDEDGNVVLENTNVHMDPTTVVEPIIFIPRTDMPSMPYQYKHSPTIVAMSDMSTYMHMADYSYPSYLNYLALIAEECINVINQNCMIIFNAGILSILQRFALDNKYIEQFMVTHERFFGELRFIFEQFLIDFGKDLVEKINDVNYFMYKISEAKAMVSRKENDFLNHIMTTIFSNKTIDTYGFACYIASISNINIDENEGFNNGSALAFALTGSAEFTKYDAAKISEAVETNVVNFYYRCIDMINTHNITSFEYKSSPMTREVYNDEDILREIEEDDKIAEEDLL